MDKKFFDNTIIAQYAVTGVPLKVYVDGKYLTITDPDDVENPLMGQGMEPNGEMYPFSYQEVDHLLVAGNVIDLETYNKAMADQYKTDEPAEEAPEGEEEEPEEEPAEEEPAEEEEPTTEEGIEMSKLSLSEALPPHMDPDWVALGAVGAPVIAKLLYDIGIRNKDKIKQFINKLKDESSKKESVYETLNGITEISREVFKAKMDVIKQQEKELKDKEAALKKEPIDEALSNPMAIIVKNEEAGPVSKLWIRNRIKFVLDSITPAGTEYHVNGADYGKAMNLAKDNLVYESYSVAGRPVDLIKGKKSDGTDWKVKFKNGKEVALADVLALIKPFPKGISESVNESKYVVQYWKYTSEDDYDLFDKTVDATSEEEAIEKVEKLDRRGKDFKVIKKDGQMIEEAKQLSKLDSKKVEAALNKANLKGDVEVRAFNHKDGRGPLLYVSYTNYGDRHQVAQATSALGYEYDNDGRYTNRPKKAMGVADVYGKSANWMSFIKESVKEDYAKAYGSAMKKALGGPDLLTKTFLTKAEYQKAKKMKGFDTKDWEWNAKKNIYRYQDIDESLVATNKKTGKDVTQHLNDYMDGKISKKEFEKLTGLKKESVNEASLPKKGSIVKLQPSINLISFLDIKDQDLEVIGYKKTGLIGGPSEFLIVKDAKGKKHEINPEYIQESVNEASLPDFEDVKDRDGALSAAQHYITHFRTDVKSITADELAAALKISNEEAEAVIQRLSVNEANSYDSWKERGNQLEKQAKADAINAFGKAAKRKDFEEMVDMFVSDREINGGEYLDAFRIVLKKYNLEDEFRKQLADLDITKTPYEMNEDVSSPYIYQVGDMVQNVNPTCPHHGSKGIVMSVEPDELTYSVTNVGDTFRPGMRLTKTLDQLEAM